MVYGAGIFHRERGTMGLSSSEVMKVLNISKDTLLKWIMLGKIKPKKYQIGGRTYNDFDQKEVDRVKRLMTNKREHGKSLLKDEK